jgi:aminocarboxymuconate-semialdehyde decarboxylase
MRQAAATGDVAHHDRRQTGMTALDIVDIHTHLWPPAWGAAGRHERSGHRFAPEILSRLLSPETRAAEFANGGVSGSVVTATLETLFGTDNPYAPGALREANDWLAELPKRDPSVVAFGTVDAFAGDAGAREAERAIVRLGLSGLVIDSARAGKFVGHPSTLPTLQVAARHRVPVFVHPVFHPDSTPLIEAAGAAGNSLGRGLMNGVALLSIIQSTLLDDLPELNLIFATLGIGAIAQASRHERYTREARAVGPRPKIYFDTMGSDPAIIRALTGFFGAERVLAGSDWPILGPLDQASLRRGLAEAGLTEAEQRLVAGGNARILGLGQTSARAA